MPFALALHDISKTFRETSGKKTVALDRVSLEISQGEFFVFVGPSGSGKSTLLRIMSGLESPSGGAVRRGEGITTSDMSFVFQQFALLPWRTVSQNIALGLLARDMTETERQNKVRKELTRFGLDAFGDSFPRELSGGMKQRVGIARALVGEPKLIFMDEPFSELDSFTAESLRKETLRVWEETRPTIIMVTHLIPEALELADRIAVLTPHPGKIEKIITNPLSRPRAMRSEEAFRLEDELARLIKP